MGNVSLNSLIFSKKGFSTGQIKLEKFRAFLVNKSACAVKARH